MSEAERKQVSRETTGQQAAEFLRQYDDSVFPADFSACYEPLECFSRNELWETLLVRDRASGQRCVCKAYHKESFLHPEGEGEILASLNRPGFPRLLGRFEDASSVYILREYLPGQPLDAYAAERQLGPTEAIGLLLQLCDLLSYLHSLQPPVIHRDVKPSNIIRSPQGQLGLIDFGISRRYDEKAESDTVLNRYPSRGQ